MSWLSTDFPVQLPTQHELKRYRSLRLLGRRLAHPALWHCNRKSIAAACFIGLLIALMPVPLQMLLAASAAVIFNANIPLSISLVWITNPLTMGPIFLTTYQVGRQMLGWPQLQTGLDASPSMNELLHIGAPLMVGGLFLGTLLGLCAYYTALWLGRRHTLQRWQLRKRRRQQRALSEHA